MGNEQSKIEKVIPPISHKIELNKLKVGDHIYRRLCGIKALIGYHHGIVTQVTEPYTDADGIQVIEMTEINGIQVNTLTGFLKECDCRLVYYNVPTLYEIFHASGTCHFWPSSSIQEIMQRIDEAKEIIKSIDRLKNTDTDNPNIYSLSGVNCEEFAVWIKLGIYKGISNTQINKLFNINSNTMISAGISTVSFVMKYADDIATSMAITGKNTAKNAANAGSKTVATEVVENTAKYTARGIGGGIGVAVAIEAVCTAHTVYKYKTDYRYLKCDMWRDLSRSWTVTAICTGIGIACLPIGWWAILPAAAAGIFTKWIFDKFDVFDGKSQKEKLYIEYGLNENSCVKELRAIRRKLKREIRKEKLHPDQWPSNLADKERPSRLEKYIWLTAIMGMLDEDIGNGAVMFEKKNRDKSNEAIEYIKL